MREEVRTTTETSASEALASSADARKNRIDRGARQKNARLAKLHGDEVQEGKGGRDKGDARPQSGGRPHESRFGRCRREE